LNELDFLFSLPRDQTSATLSVPLPDPTVHGIRMTCKDLAVIHPGIPRTFEHFNIEVIPGEKIGVYASTAVAKTALARASCSSVEVFFITFLNLFLTRQRGGTSRQTDGPDEPELNPRHIPIPLPLAGDNPCPALRPE
jgi:hypothetical protein